jgi:hypothetical protein
MNACFSGRACCTFQNIYVQADSQGMVVKNKATGHERTRGREVWSGNHRSSAAINRRAHASYDFQSYTLVLA